jgi:hypothetical protein
MSEIKPPDQEQSGIIEAGDLIPYFMIVYGFTILLALLA